MVITTIFVPGVSNAILNSVIFCHQEDSTWPLDDGQKVKERFDEIFDSEKYSECFEHLKKLRKEYSHDIKSLGKKFITLILKDERVLTCCNEVKIIKMERLISISAHRIGS